MSATDSSFEANGGTLQRGGWRAYWRLCKHRVVLMLVFTAVVGMALAAPGSMPLDAVVLGSLGLAFASAGAAAFNHLADHHFDAVMRRTQRRPLPTGGLTTARAAVFAAAISIIGLGILYVGVNPLTAWLTLAAGVGYAGVYTLFLKHATSQNIVIGGAAGAMPPVIGWTAVTGSLDPHALLLFLIVFAWTPPHFWALALKRHEEYAAAGIPMLPVTHGDRFTRWQILLYTALLVGVSLLPFATFMAGGLYLVGAVVLGVWYLYYAVRLLREEDNEELPMRAFRFSLYYLCALFTVLLVDRHLPMLFGG